MNVVPQVEKLDRQEFKSTLPPYLLDNLSEGERYLVETMSKLENKSNWLVDAAITNRAELIKADVQLRELILARQQHEAEQASRDEDRKRLAELWDWMNKFSGKWTILWAVGLASVSAGLSALIKFFLDKIKP